MGPMEPNSDATIVGAERVGTRLVVTFDDGRVSVFSAPALYVATSIADEVHYEDEMTEND